MDKIYTPEVIADLPFPNQQAQQNVTESGIVTGSAPLKPASIPNQPFPQQMVAQELLSTALNTRTKKIIQEFAFAPSGAIQIGDFKNGVTGDIRISPMGIIARNSLGDTTFAIDAETGDAFFKGIVQAGSIIAEGILQGASITGSSISGTTITGTTITGGSITGTNIVGGSININNHFKVNSSGDFSYTNTDPTVIMEILQDDTVVKMTGLQLGLPGTSNGTLELYVGGLLYAYITPDEGFVLLDTGGAFTIEGTGAPSAPTGNKGSIYVDQSGGKNRLMVRFPSGASQQLAIEP